MAPSFKAGMAKLLILGRNRNSLIDCSDVVLATKGPAGLQIACNASTVPTLTDDRACYRHCQPRSPTLK
jgi:manganese peroxidase